MDAEEDVDDDERFTRAVGNGGRWTAAQSMGKVVIQI